MAVQKDYLITFNIENISGDAMTVTAHPDTPLSIVITENGIISSHCSQYRFFHKEELINPLYSLNYLGIADGDTVLFIQNKSTNDIPTRTYNRRAHRTESVDVIDLAPEFDEQFNIPVRAKTRPTITPPRPDAISTQPLPNLFPKSEKQNTEFWNNIYTKFSGK